MEILIQHIVESLPSTPFGYIIHIVVGLFFAVICGSFVEYIMHKYVMHIGFPPSREPKLFPEQHYNHAVLHHGTFYKTFNSETDSLGKEASLAFSKLEIFLMQIMLLPAFLLIAWFSPVIAVCASLTALAHNSLWNVIHREMHQPKHPAWTKWALYRMLARNHFLHHRHTGKNFNVVLPFADYILGTKAQAKPEELMEIAQLGYGPSPS